jgi:cleavage stimulation factor subunit 2
MASSGRNTRSVFVGNIAFEATEDDMIRIFSTVGPVLSFRIIKDMATGKPKGFGFCE